MRQKDTPSIPVSLDVRPQENTQVPNASVQAANKASMDTVSERQQQIQLYQILVKRFDREELHTLCFKLGVSYDDLPAEGRANKARELIDHLNRRNRLLELIETVKELRPDISWGIKIIDIPFVIVAMTHDEATDLKKETVFDNPEVATIERTRFQQFRASLQEHGVADMLPHYGKQRESWKPHIHRQSTIKKITLDIADLTNQQRSEIPSSPLVCPQFFSSDFFTEDQDLRLKTWDKLSREGCVIIVDAISMFHPTLHRVFSQSEMGSNERVAMLVFSPVNSNAIPVNQLIEREIGPQMQRAFARFSKQFDRMCEFGVGDLRALKRWLFAILPETTMVVQNQRLNPSNRRVFRERMGEPHGIENAIFGQRGR